LHNMVNFGSLTAEICWWVWSTPAHFNQFCKSWFRYCTDIAQRRSTNFAGCLAVFWAGTLYVHFWGSCPL